MRIPPSLKSEAVYARDIMKAGLEAAAPAGRSTLAPAALCVAVGVLGALVARKARFGNSAFMGGLLGGALGFTGGVAWGTREHTKVCFANAAHKVQAVRDAHWLEKNPIAYA